MRCSTTAIQAVDAAHIVIRTVMEVGMSVNILSYDSAKVWSGQEILDWIDENQTGSRSKIARELGKSKIIPDHHYAIWKQSKSGHALTGHKDRATEWTLQRVDQ